MQIKNLDMSPLIEKEDVNGIMWNTQVAYFERRPFLIVTEEHSTALYCTGNGR